jgi:hypothetical protein
VSASWSNGSQWNSRWVFLAHRVGFGDRDFEHEVEFVVGNTIFGIPVLHHANESGDLGFGAYFFGDLADQSYLNALARLDVSAGQEPPTFGALAGEEEVVLAADDGPGDDLRGCCGHGCLLSVSVIGDEGGFPHHGRRLGFDSNTGASALSQLLVINGSHPTKACLVSRTGRLVVWGAWLWIGFNFLAR